MVATLTCNELCHLETPVTGSPAKELMIEAASVVPGGSNRAVNLNLPVTVSSGVWKIRLQMRAAKCVKANVLLWDEPNVYLNVSNIRSRIGWDLCLAATSAPCSTRLFSSRCALASSISGTAIGRLSRARRQVPQSVAESYPDRGVTLAWATR